MKNQNQNSSFDERETEHLIAAFGIKTSPDTYRDLQAFLKSQKEQFIDQERQREANTNQRSNRSH